MHEVIGMAERFMLLEVIGMAERFILLEVFGMAVRAGMHRCVCSQKHPSTDGLTDVFGARAT